MTKTLVRLEVNGVRRDAWVSASDLLLEVLHDGLGLGEVRYGCGEGVCGTCTVLLDGEPVSACLMLAVQAEGHAVTTLSALPGEDGSLHPLQESFLRLGGSQCGFCTPGVILTAYSLARRERAPSREQIRYELVGNLCRCTGYTKILDAIESYIAGLSAEPADPREPDPGEPDPGEPDPGEPDPGEPDAREPDLGEGAP
jgi:carbon-monoxide dehydrogenase small subunit